MKQNKRGKHKDLRQTQSKKSQTNQVRIIGGQFKRRQITFIDADGLRPTPDRLRETLFNWLMHDLQGAYVLDACAGSGVLGFESLSRGAAAVTLIEANPKQAQMLENACLQLKINPNQVQVLTGLAEQLLQKNNKKLITNPDQGFDLIFLDPPYAQNLWQTLLDCLLEGGFIMANTLIYLESDRQIEDMFVAKKYDFILVKQARVGQIFAYLLQFVID